MAGSIARASSAHSGELLTLSVGAAANNIAALYFNVQWKEVRRAATAGEQGSASTSSPFPSPAVEWRVLFRSVASSSSSPTLIPRLVAASLSSETGYYAGLGDVIDYAALLAPSSTSQQNWDGRVVVAADAEDLRSLQQRQQPQQTQRGQPSHLLPEPQCWTDLLTIPSLHPKNVYTLPPLQNENEAFEYFSQGQELIHERGALEAIMDRVRWFVEECDHLQGVQLIADATDAWGGVADCIVSELRDEYEKTPLLFLGLHTPAADRPHAKCAGGDALSLAELNSLLCLSRQCQSTDAYLPIYSPSTIYPSSPAIINQRIALAWQLLSLPYCRPHSDTDLRRMLTMLVPYADANVIGCSVTWDVSPSLLRDFAHADASQHQRPSEHQQRHQQRQAQSEDLAPVTPLHSLPFTHQLQPFHTSLPTSSSTLNFRQSRRKGDVARGEDGDEEDDSSPPPPLSSSTAPHFVLASHVILRGLSSAFRRELLADLMTLSPAPQPQPHVTEVEGADGEAGLCDVYACDAVGRWLRQQSEVVGSVRRDAPRSFSRMIREGGMSEEDWFDCQRVLRDKAEGYLQHS